VKLLLAKEERKLATRKLNIGLIPVYLFVSAWAATELFVLFWMTYSSFKSTPEIIRNTWAFPSQFDFSGYYTDLTGTGELHVPLGSFLVHSSIVAFGAIIGIVLISIPAGYALSKSGKLNDVMFYLMLALIAIPPPALLIPEYYLVFNLGLLNNFLGVILPYISFNMPFSIVLSRAFFRAFPKDLEEAGQIDGLGDFGVFRKIVLPLSSVIVVVLLIVNFPNLWNELLYTLVILPSNSVKTVQPGLLLFQGSYYVQWNNIFAGMVLVSLPMLVFYIIFQRYILKAQFIGSIKG
jgi:ABC-type glycerol-3-phosphate transport system permease component